MKRNHAGAAMLLAALLAPAHVNANAPLRAPEPLARGTTLADPAPTLSPHGGAPATSLPATARDTDAAVNAARARLLQQLRRAADAGVITLRDGALPEGAQVVLTPGTDEIAGAPLAEEQPLAEQPREAEAALQQATEVLPGVSAASALAQAPAPRHAEPPADGGGVPLTADSDTPLGDRRAATATDADSDAAPAAMAQDQVPAPRQSPITQARSGQLTVVRPPPACLTAAELALPAAGRPEADLARISALRASLVGEFDRPNPIAALELARLYLALGFPEEASAVLAGIEPGVPGAKIAAFQAAVLSGRRPATGHPLSPTRCRGAHGIWRAMAEAAAGDHAAAVESVATSFDGLADLGARHRSLAAGELGLVALDRGRRDLAERLRALGLRSHSGNTPAPTALRLLDARLFLRRGEIGAALAVLRGLRGSGDRYAAAATTEIADLVLVDRLTLRDTADLRLDLRALGRLWSGTETGAKATARAVRLEARAEGRAAALASLAHALDTKIIDQAGYLRLVSELAETPKQGPQEIPLALLYQRNPARFLTALEDPAFRRALGLSLAEIGAPRLAEEMLRPQDFASPALTAALAEAHLDAGELLAAARLRDRLPKGQLRSAIDVRLHRAEGNALAALDAMRDNDRFSPRERARTAWAGGDHAAASVELTRAATETAADGLTGARRAVAAHLAGASAAATGARSEGQEEEAGGLDLLLQPLAPLGSGDPQAAVATMLDRLGRERRAMKELLEDG